MARQCWGDESSLQHLRQLGALRTARIIHVAGNLLRAFGGEFIEPIDELWAVDVQHVELADQIGEDVGAFSI
jgi:hypothetical protein